MATQTHEFKGKTVDDAVEEGLRVLGLARGNVAIEVVQKGSRGIFGLGSEPAIVRLTPQAAQTDEAVAAAPVHLAPAVDLTPARTTIEESVVPEPPQPATADSIETVAAETPVAATTAPAASSETAGASEEDADQELVTMATHLLSEMVRLMGFQAEVRASWQDDGDESFGEHDDEEQEEGHTRSGRYLLLDVEGSELGALIGRRGETLENIQYLLRLMVNQKLHKWKNIVIDVEHYKARRIAQLTQLAERMAEQVARTGRSISLEPMPANERRVVHMTLRDHPKVYTESYGDGGRRKVHIFART
ncbi:MAG: KH domain-containing protein [Caldilinea sp. CFX5]|nr:KH domain-containing protein [Caldilinea sp. CFX5]